MNFTARVALTIKKHQLVEKGDLVIVAVSGGADSVALTHVLAVLAKENSFSIHLAHLNHQTRGTANLKEEELVRSFAQELGVPLTVKAFNVPLYAEKNKLSPEEAARKIRYDFLIETKKQCQAKKIALGHTADDQVETVLMHFLQGAGLDGLGGMKPKRDNVYVRPLLEIYRLETENYCRQNSLKFCVDSSNLETNYLRNRIRLQLIPCLLQYNPNLKKTILKTSSLLRETNAYLSDTANILYPVIVKKAENKRVINLKELAQLAPVIQKLIVKKTLSELRDTDITFDHVETIIQLDTYGSKILDNFPAPLKVKKEYGDLIISFDEETTIPVNDNLPLNIAGTTNLLNCQIKGEIIKIEDFSFPRPNKLKAFFDYEQLRTKKLTVRNRKDGDYFVPSGMTGGKKLKKLLIDLKIPRQKRDLLPLVLAEDTIIWVGGIRQSNKFPVTSATKEVLQLELVYRE